MFIRKTLTRRVAGVDYSSYRLVRNERVDGRVKQITLINLGADFELPQALWPNFCARIADVLSPQDSLVNVALDGRIEACVQRYVALLKPRSQDGQDAVQKAKRVLSQVSSVPEPVGASELPAQLPGFDGTVPEPACAPPAAIDPEWVDSNSTTFLDVRSVGVELLALHAVRALGIDSVLRSAGFNGVSLAAAMAQLVGRIVQPGSDLATHRWVRQNSALPELWGFDFGRMSLHRMYEVGSRLWSVKPKLEQAIYGTLQARFGLNNTVALYDLTNTYFEGLGTCNPSAVRGCSKEKRSDAPLMSLGLVLDSAGFVRRSGMFPGNVYEPSTVEKMLTDLGAAKGALVVLDRGFVTAPTLAWLSENGYRYLVMSKERRDLSQAAQTIYNAQDQAIQIERIIDPAVEGKVQEVRLLCHSSARAQKENPMVKRQQERMTNALTNLHEGLSKKHGSKTIARVNERVGRIKVKHPSVARFFKIALIDDGTNVTAIDFKFTAKANSKAALPGHYVIRSNDLTLSAESLWRTYIQLTDVESVFRSLKSELGLRPVFHQTEIRCKAHLWISVLAYQCVQFLRYELKTHGIHASWASLRKSLGQSRITARFERQDGAFVHLRKNQEPTVEQQTIYAALGIKPPAASRRVFQSTDL